MPVDRWATCTRLSFHVEQLTHPLYVAAPQWFTRLGGWLTKQSKARRTFARRALVLSRCSQIGAYERFFTAKSER
ncbi:hypothetical protein Pan181_45330 [Aeoliella mucimassa]|uniref:Uncharacterized protein n=1 Tax=Aeoliella mucimassa TaxID=2527972 RepID=A0A518AU92_9BACT|nr:hypothetical protein Pan181_45330 [Aeoliella mucimassa]